MGWLVYSGDNNDKLVRVGGLAELVTDPAYPSAVSSGTVPHWLTITLPVAV
jgi:hypothetical protein